MKLTRLTETLKAKGIRPEELATKTRLSIETIRNARRGKSVSFSTAHAIAHGLGVKPEELA